jgi:hypothetical protein
MTLASDDRLCWALIGQPSDSPIDAGVRIREAVRIDSAGMAPLSVKSEFDRRLAFHGAVARDNRWTRYENVDWDMATV